jgi:branched-chain amino acid transport system permease protein
MMESLSQAVLNGLLTGGVYLVVTLGIALVFGIMRIVNFAHGEFVMLGAYVTYWSFTLMGMNPYLTLVLSSLVLFVLGLLTYKFLVEKILDAPPINQVLLTFGISVVMQNLALMLWSGNSVAMDMETRVVKLGAVQAGQDRIILFFLGLAITILLSLVLTRTYLGKTMSAVSQNRRAAYLLGVNVPLVYLLSFALAAALAGLAGGLVSIVMYASPYIGGKLGLRAFAILTMAGLGNMGAIIAASFLMGLIESFVGIYVPQGPGWAEGVSFMIILAVLAFRPSGLKGLRAE